MITFYQFLFIQVWVATLEMEYFFLLRTFFLGWLSLLVVVLAGFIISFSNSCLYKETKGVGKKGSRIKMQKFQ